MEHSSTLLRLANFTSLNNQFSGGDFASLNLLAGQSYFIGFRNVGGLGVNFTTDSGAVALSSLRYGWSNTGFYPEVYNGTPNTQAILQFRNSRPVPTPALLPGLIGLSASLLRQRKQAKSEDVSN